MTDIRGNTALLLHCSGLAVSPAMLETLAGDTNTDTVNWDGWWPLLAIVSGERPNMALASDKVKLWLEASSLRMCMC